MATFFEKQDINIIFYDNYLQICFSFNFDTFTWIYLHTIFRARATVGFINSKGTPCMFYLTWILLLMQFVDFETNTGIVSLKKGTFTVYVKRMH